MQRSHPRRRGPSVHTDWLIVRRLAVELEQAIRSARVREVGLTSDDRFALRVRARGAGGDTVLVDAKADSPLAYLEHGVESAARPGWSRAIADAVRGMRVERVSSRTGDRLLAIDLATLSRFGVLSAYRLVAELVPRFGNVLLLKGDVIVAAAREFSPEQNPRRPIVAGDAYRPPPLPTPELSPDALEKAIGAVMEAREPARERAAANALRATAPLLGPLLAASLVAELMAEPPRTAAAALSRLASRTSELLEQAEAAAGSTERIYLYRDEGRMVQAHVVPLAQFEHLSVEQPESMLEATLESVDTLRSLRLERDADSRRAALRARLSRQAAAIESERRDVDTLLGTDPPERLRVEGELLYAHHAEVPPRAETFVPPSDPSITIALDPDLDAKANAAAIFKRYRKAVGRRAHAGRRLAELGARLAAVEELAWELERADPGALDELADEADRLERRSRPPKGSPQVRRGALEVALGEDARVLVGRSPRNNAELTFRIARPDDLWFHARGVPGAHVVLRIDSSRAPTTAELRSAAELAAYHSKARTSGTVPVDYTARKYVRKQQSALPGLVWYTNAQTIDVTPRAART